MKKSFLWMYLVSCLAAVPAMADTHPNLERGITGESQAVDIDHINTFNGTLALTIPIGNRYPVGSALDYRFVLSWSGRPWDFSDSCGADCGTVVTPQKRANAGFGWMLSLGRLESPSLPGNDSGKWLYVSPDGGEHSFEPNLHDADPIASGFWYTRDGSYLRMQDLGGGLAQVELPDGQIQLFGSDGELKQISDRYGNRVTLTPLNGGLTWQVADSAGRTQTVNFVPDAVLGKRVASVVLSAFGGTTATYTFGYTTMTAQWPCDDSGSLSGSVTASFLTSVTLPDGSSYTMPDYALDQTAGCRTPGSILSVKLPTLGKIAWTYQPYVYPGSATLRYRDTVNGVATRTIYDAAGTSLGTWQYTTALDTASPAQELKNTVVTPLGHRTEYYFSVSKTNATSGWSIYEYGLPLTHYQTDATGTRFLSTRVFNSAGTQLRSTYVRYEHDATTTTLPKLPFAAKLNQRLVSVRTVYDDDAGHYADTDLSDFDGLGHYRTAQAGGNFDAGNARTTYRQYNAGSGSYPSSFTMPPVYASWVLNLYGYEWQAENGVTAARTYAVDPNTGWISRARIQKLDSGGESNQDILIERLQDGLGNLSSERYYGGDTQWVPTGNINSLALPQPPQYRIDYTTQSGTRATSTYVDGGGTALSFKTLDQTIDPSTGLPNLSRDTAGIATSYEYDSLGRLRFVKPETGQDGWTEKVYTRATGPGALAQVQILRRPNGGGAALADSVVKLDPFGRVWQEQQKMPDGSYSTRETLYNALGWKSSVSELGNTGKTTRFLSYDPFGRPATVRPPDGSAHDVTLYYTGVRLVSRVVKVGTTLSGGAVTTSNAWTTETYDRQGRLYQVKEEAEPNFTNTITTYTYDVGNRLNRVKQATSVATQNRWFSYDQRGFLLSEQHPEKGATGNGLVYSTNYDALGHAGRRYECSGAACTDRTADVSFTYDRAERVTIVSETGGRVLKTFTYGTSNAAGVRNNGKLVTATRYNYVGAPYNGTAQVDETYTYGGRQGRVSRRNTQHLYGTSIRSFAQTWSYDPLGNVSSLGYPDCTFAECVSTPRTVSPVYTQGRLTSIPGFANAITYHPNGMVYQVTHANGVTDTQANDPNGMARPSALSAQNAAGTVWSSGTYAYDGVGNVNKVGNSYFLYDHVSRLVDGHAYDGPTGAGNLRSQTYTYDPLGNLTAVGGDAWAAGRAIPTAAASNRLTGGTYDTAGNLVAWNGNSYEYDALGKMTRMLAGAEDWRYTYTAGDERLFEFRTAGGGANWALRDLNGKVLREFQEQYAWNPREYVYRDGQLLASSFYTEGVRHFHLDHLGTPRAITDANGNRVAYHAYFPFGEEMTSFAQDSEQMKLTGHERDFANASSVADDLDYMHARHYNPQVGRFLSIDPLFRPTSGPQGLNRYSYVGGRPLTLVDRYGLDPCFTDDSGTFRCDTTTTTTPIFLDPLQGLSDLIGGRLFMDSFPFDSWSNIRDGFWQGIKIAEQLALHCDQSYGVAIDLSTLNPFTGGGGSIDGWNVQYVPGHGVGLYSYSTPADFGSAGFDLGLSLTMNTAIGEGNWTGDFLTGVGSVGDVAFGAFGSPANPSELGWHGLQAGGSLGLPLGVGLTDTNYKQRRDLSFMRWWCH